MYKRTEDSQCIEMKVFEVYISVILPRCVAARSMMQGSRAGMRTGKVVGTDGGVWRWHLMEEGKDVM